MLYRDYAKDKYQNAFQLSNAEGVPCVLKGSKGKKIRNYELYGNSVQDGTPSPDTPIEIQSVGDLVTDEASPYYGKYDVAVTVCGKNLIPYPYYDTSKTINGITFTDNGDGSVTANGTATGTAYFRLAKGNNIVPGVSKKYVVSGGKSNSLRLFLDVYNNNKWVKSYSTSSSPDGSMIIDFSEIFATYENPSFDLMISIYTGGVCNSVVFKPQLELGSNATSYEPYKGSITEHIYLDEPLRKIGDYADYIDFKNQKVVRQTGKFVFNGTEGWSSYSSYNGFSCPITDMKFQYSGYGYCNYYVRIASLSKKGLRFGANNNYLYFTQVYSSDSTLTLDEWKTQLSNLYAEGNPLIVEYILETPIEENISLPSLKTFKDTNLISADSTISSSDIKAKYIKK